MPCFHYQPTSGGCKLQLQMPQRIREIYNKARGWEYGVPDGHRDDWKHVLPCTNNMNGLFGCPFYTNHMREEWLHREPPKPAVQVPAPPKRNIKI